MPAVWAQSAWPQKPVRVVIPYAAGGVTDSVGRKLVEKLGQVLGQNFIVENKGGAGGTVGMAEVAKAAPDGHTSRRRLASHLGLLSGPASALSPDGPSIITSRTSWNAGPTSAKVIAPRRASSLIQNPPAKVLPDPRPPSSTHVRHPVSAGSGTCSGRTTGVARITLGSACPSNERIASRTISLLFGNLEKTIDASEQLGPEALFLGFIDHFTRSGQIILRIP